MNLPKEAIIEFQQIHKLRCGVELEFNEAEIEAEKMLNLVYLFIKKNTHKNDQTQNLTKNIF